MDPRKAGYIVLWLACVVGFVVMRGTTWALVAEIVFWGMVAIHAFQWLAFRELLHGSKNGAFGNLAGTLLFGIVHINEVRAEVEAEQGEA